MCNCLTPRGTREQDTLSPSPLWNEGRAHRIDRKDSEASSSSSESGERVCGSGRLDRALSGLPCRLLSVGLQHFRADLRSLPPCFYAESF